MLQNLEKNTKKLLEAGQPSTFDVQKFSLIRQTWDLNRQPIRKLAKAFFYLSLARLGPFKTILFLSCACGLLLFGFLVVEIKWDSLNNLANKNMEK